jgi:hypothetical protein
VGLPADARGQIMGITKDHHDDGPTREGSRHPAVVLCLDLHLRVRRHGLRPVEQLLMIQVLHFDLAARDHLGLLTSNCLRIECGSGLAAFINV